jgi:hypothetical protein
VVGIDAVTTRMAAEGFEPSKAEPTDLQLYENRPIPVITGNSTLSVALIYAEILAVRDTFSSNFRTDSRSAAAAFG